MYQDILSFDFIPSTVYISSKDKGVRCKLISMKFVLFLWKYNIHNYYIEQSNCKKIIIIVTDFHNCFNLIVTVKMCLKINNLISPIASLLHIMLDWQSQHNEIPFKVDKHDSYVLKHTSNINTSNMLTG